MVSPSGNRGFTLVELMMALLVMTVGLLGLLQSMQVAYQRKSANTLRAEAVLLAEEQMNAIRRETSSFKPLTTATRVVSGIERRYLVTRETLPAGGDAERLRVAVQWVFRNVTTTHDIYAFRRL